MRISDWSSDVCSSDLHDYTMPAFCFNTVMIQQLHDSVWSSRQEGWKAGEHLSQAFGMKTIHVFFRTDMHYDFFLVNLRRKGELYQNAVHLIVRVQLLNLLKQCFFTDAIIETNQGSPEA